ncbi:hypothetical protein PKHYL_40760 [Psychrobacter sp. KH172YL61]|nr:hypothetical protein PKHYL_40760 [Psychrobacter sp. KH172YL61]
MSLAKLHSTLHDLYWPEYVLVIELQIAENKYYILEFGEVDLKKKNDSKNVGIRLKGFNGIAYKTDKDEDFFSKGW